jgi:pyruvate,water dikinase
VTNDGGLTSHAAIIARELNKPCLVGTKVATDVFKDGDVVEVDTIRRLVTLVCRRAVT